MKVHSYTNTESPLWHCILYTLPENYSMSFKVYEIGVLYFREGIEIPKELSLLVKGYIKFDFCSNWDFSDCIHFCSHEQAKELGNILDQCYRIAAEEGLLKKASPASSSIAKALLGPQ